ncbi:uncharacterized protein [Nicotiana sylvestris]|uniref:Uncharacterized protein LOC104231793 n=1 Tax=Nicotiana sylvestris TaxID=4096 RepID=A0A1U7X891_NICSY|nr:PREDICTED: uncharacterized protein LOC104231793 [Nicotiana sylvestris]
MNNLSLSSLKKLDHEDELLLTLSLSPTTPMDSTTPTFSLPLNLVIPPPLPPSPPPPLPTLLYGSDVNIEENIIESNVALVYDQMNEPSGARMRVGLTTRARKKSTPSLKEGESETITPPYPWATTKRAIVHTLDYLISNGITVISGEVQCKKCQQQYQIQYDLQEKFKEIATFILKTKSVMRDRAPIIWMNPNLPNCKYCNQNNCVKPIISERRSSINWLFLLLGQMIGCCKLDALKYFCMHTKNHRTGAKDRLVYLTYLELCKQLDPEGPFDR